LRAAVAVKGVAIDAVKAHDARSFSYIDVVGSDHPAFARRYWLRCVEAEDRGGGIKAADQPAAASGSRQCVRGIFHDGNTGPVGNLKERGHIAGQPGVMHNNDCFGSRT